jgi:hypothetical protein
MTYRIGDASHEIVVVYSQSSFFGRLMRGIVNYEDYWRLEGGLYNDVSMTVKQHHKGDSGDDSCGKKRKVAHLKGVHNSGIREAVERWRYRVVGYNRQ